MKIFVGSAVLLGVMLALSACSGGGSSSGTPLTSKPITPDSLSTASYTKTQDLEEQSFSQATSGFYKRCSTFTESIKSGDVFKKQILIIKPSFSMGLTETETVEGVTSNTLTSKEYYSDVNISGFSGKILDKNPANRTCTMKSDDNSQSASCESDAKATPAFAQYEAAHPDMSDEDCDEVSSDNSGDLKSSQTYEAGTFQMVDGKKVNVYVIKMQNQDMEKCGNQAAKKIKTTTISIVTNELVSDADESDCGSSWVFAHTVRQDADDKLISDTTMTVLSAPKK